MTVLTKCVYFFCRRFRSTFISINVNVKKEFRISRSNNLAKFESVIMSKGVLKYIISFYRSRRLKLSLPMLKPSVFRHKFMSSSITFNVVNWKTPAAITGCSLGIALFCYNITYCGNLLRPVYALTPSISKFNFIADVVTKAAPAVVFLEIKGVHPESGKRVTVSNGSGFLVRDYGLILTSAHVVTNKSKVTVKLQGGEMFEGRVTAIDPVHDLATVKIDAQKRLPVIPLGKSSNVRPGEFVVAMGSPLSLSNTVTSGIVSSSLRKSKELGLNNKDMQYIQTDAVISDGKAIGINNLKVTTGISFAIPADYATSFIEEAERLEEKAHKDPFYIPNGKEAKRRFMGISMLSLTPLIIMELKDRLAGFPDVDSGVYVHKVIVGSPAYEGGLHAGDIIVNINGQKVQSTADIYHAVDMADDLEITLIRGNNLRRFRVTTEELF